jgi:hypothetical protein
MTDGRRVVLQYKPRSGPRRRITFQPDHRREGAACQYWRIEEVYSTDAGAWHETGREHVTEPDLLFERDGTVDPEVPVDA